MNTELNDGVRRRKFDTEKLRRAIDAEFDSEPDFSDPVAKAPAGAARAKNQEAQVSGAGAAKADLREEILYEAGRRVVGAAAALIFCLFDVALLVWFEVGAASGYILPVYVSLNQNVTGFLAADFILLLIAGALCFHTVARGARALFTLRPVGESLAFLAFLGAAVNDLYLLAQHGVFVKNGVMIYSSVAAAALLFSQLDRLCRLRAVKIGLKAWPKSSDGLYQVRRMAMPGSFAGGEEGGGGYELLYPEPVRLDDFDLHSAFDVLEQEGATPFDRAARYMTPALAVTALLTLVLSLAMGHGAYGAVAGFAAVLCAGTPVLMSFTLSWPLLRVTRRLRDKALLSDYITVEQVAGTYTLTADARLLFPPETVSIHAIKAFSGVKIEKAVLDAASVIHAVDGPLKKAFLDLIVKESYGGLEEVQHIALIDDMGITASIYGAEVLLGSRELLRAKGVTLPSRDYEAKYAAQGQDVLYLAVGGQLSAMFVVGYYSNKEILSSLKKLGSDGFTLYVSTSDVNITSSLIADRLQEDDNCVTFMGGDEAALFRRLTTSEDDTGLTFWGSVSAFAQAIMACCRLGKAGRAVTVMQVAGAVIAAGLIVLTVFLAGARAVTPVTLLELQGLLALPPLLTAVFRKN